MAAVHHIRDKGTFLSLLCFLKEARALKFERIIERQAKSHTGNVEDYLTFIGHTPEAELRVTHLNVTELKRYLRQVTKIYSSPKKIIELFLAQKNDNEAAEAFTSEVEAGAHFFRALCDLNQILVSVIPTPTPAGKKRKPLSKDNGLQLARKMTL